MNKYSYQLISNINAKTIFQYPDTNNGKKGNVFIKKIASPSNHLNFYTPFYICLSHEKPPQNSSLRNSFQLNKTV